MGDCYYNDGHFDNVYINDGGTGNVDDCGRLQFEETGQSAYWMIIKRGSEYYPQNDCLLFTYWDGDSSWHELLRLDPINDYIDLNASLDGIHIKHDAPALSLDNLVLPTYKTPGNGNIFFEDTISAQNASLYQIRVADPMNDTEFGPGIATDYSFWVEKDIHTYGALFTLTDPAKCAGGGAVSIGPGFYTKETPPCVVVPGEMLVNLVSYSQNFGNNYWETFPDSGYKQYVTNDDQDAEFEAPDENNFSPRYTAWKITCNENCTGVISQPIALDSTKKYKILSVWLKGAAGGERIFIRIGVSGGKVCTLTTKWKRYNYLLETQTTTPKSVMFFNLDHSGTFYIWGAQLTESIVPYYWSYVPTTDGPSDEFDTLCLYKMTGEWGVYPLANLKCANVNADSIELSGGASGANPSPKIVFPDYVDNSGAPSVSHIDLHSGLYGFGISDYDLDILTNKNIALSSDTNFDVFRFNCDNDTLTIGGDTYLSRSSANTLSTSSNFTVGGNLNCTGDIDCGDTLTAVNVSTSVIDTTSGDLTISPTGNVKATKDIHIDTTAGTPKLALDVSGTEKSALEFDGTDTYLSTTTGKLVLSPSSYDVETYKITLIDKLGVGGSVPEIRFKETGVDEIAWCSAMSGPGYPWIVANVTTPHLYAWIDYDGKMWCDDYDEFSHKLPETRVERITELKTEVEKPHATRDDEGRIICSVCGKKLITECKDREHIRINQETFGHSLGCLSMGAAKLSLEVNDKIEELETQITTLQQKIAELNKNSNS